VYQTGEDVLDEEPKEVEGVTVTKMVSIQKLAKFIDVFNYYPIQVNALKKKNDSDELTYIMSSNMKGSFLDFKHEKEVSQKSDEEKHLFKLLALVSEKLYERFRNL